ncbi:MAG TPA: caspase family protein [Kofleriaceae bacterium]|nr:caspase family protein [Kofleriaceae bacterium]
MRTRVPFTALVAACLATAAVTAAASCSGGGAEKTRGVRADKQGGSSSSTHLPRIWVLSVGVSKYKDESLSLEYADRDATAIDTFFAGDAGGRVPSERRFLLVNENATRAAVLTALTDLSKRSAPDDMIVLFLAMHGMPDAGGDLYYLSHDTDPKALVGTGLPQRDLEYAISRAPARRVVLLADACHAGQAGFAGFQGKRGAAAAETNRLVGQLAESKPGIAVLTAASATEASAEGKKWGGGHGVFTHHLLAGLAGGADDDGNGFISIRELFDFTYRNVSKDTSGDQHPELKGRFDNAMPLAVLAGAHGATRVAAHHAGRGASDVDPDPTMALKAVETSKNSGALDKACDRKDKDACARLGAMFMTGDGVVLDQQNGGRMLSQSCEAGSARACCAIAVQLYDPSEASPRPLPEAATCDAACDGGFGPACRAIEQMRRIGGPRDKDPKAAARSKMAYDLDQKQCRAGDAEACHGLAEMLLGEGEGARARKLLVRACDAGLARSCEAAARASGSGSEAARKFLEKGCEASHGRSCATIATAYFESGNAPDPRQAYAYHQRACELGITTSCRSCADLAQSEGRGAFAMPCLQRGCNGGDGGSCMMMGQMYESGDGTPQNTTLAMGMYTRACAIGYRPACARADALRGQAGHTP